MAGRKDFWQNYAQINDDGRTLEFCASLAAFVSSHANTPTLPRGAYTISIREKKGRDLVPEERDYIHKILQTYITKSNKAFKDAELLSKNMPPCIQLALAKWDPHDLKRRRLIPDIEDLGAADPRKFDNKARLDAAQVIKQFAARNNKNPRAMYNRHVLVNQVYFRDKKNGKKRLNHFDKHCTNPINYHVSCAATRCSFKDPSKGLVCPAKMFKMTPKQIDGMCGSVLPGQTPSPCNRTPPPCQES